MDREKLLLSNVTNEEIFKFLEASHASKIPMIFPWKILAILKAMHSGELKVYPSGKSAAGS